MLSFKKFIFALVALVIMTAVSTSEMVAQNQNYFTPVEKTDDIFNHWVKAGESCESITRMYYGKEDANLLLPENPWLASRPVWGRNGVISYWIHPREVIRIKLGQQPTYFQPQQSIRVVENSFMDSPVFWIGVGFFFLMLIALSIIIGILWGGRRGMQQAPTPAPRVIHHTIHTNHPMNMYVNGHITHEQVWTAPVAPTSPAPAGPDAPADGGGGVQSKGARSPVGFKLEKECVEGKS
jgi:hypothetical protein